jgi:hypothetical protein
VLRELPDGLGGMRDERWLAAKQALVPRPRCLVVADAYSGSCRAVGLAAQIALLAAVFAVTTFVAELAGAANLGTAMGFGQIAFAIVLLYLIVRR